ALSEKTDPKRTPGMQRSELVKLQEWLQAALPDAAKLRAAAPNHGHELVSKLQETGEAAALLSAAEAAAKSVAKSQAKELRRIGITEDEMNLKMADLCSSTAWRYKTTPRERIKGLIKGLQAELQEAEASLQALAQTAETMLARRANAWNRCKAKLGNQTSPSALQAQAIYTMKRARARNARNAETNAAAHINSLKTDIRTYELLAERISLLNEVLAAKEILQDTQNGLQTGVAQFVQIFEKGIFAELAEVRPKMQEQYLNAAQLNDFEVAFAGPVKRTAATEKLTEVCALDQEIRAQETALLSQLDVLKTQETAFYNARTTLSASIAALAVCPPAQFSATSESVQNNYIAMVEASHEYLHAGKTVTGLALDIADLRESAHAEVERLGVELTAPRYENVLDTLTAPIHGNSGQGPAGDWQYQYPI
ncbi:MAG: hypothetical protein Q7T16_06360, partial [Candidatus Burarchaeum sp.]